MNNKTDVDDKIKVSENIKELVIARIDAQVPSNLKLFIGSYSGMTKEQMIEHVKNGDEIGKNIIRSHLRFLRAQSSGKITSALISSE